MPHTAARAYEQRDSVQRRSHRPRHPPSHNRTLVSASEAASGLLTGLQGTDALASLSGSPYQATHATDTHPRGWVRRAGSPPPCAASFFPYSFFAGEERIWPPEGASPIAWKILRRKKTASQKKSPKLQPHCVSNSAAASGLLTGCQGTDALANLPGSRNITTHATDPHPRGGSLGRVSPRLARRLSFHILSSPEKKEYGARRALTKLSGRH